MRASRLLVSLALLAASCASPSSPEMVRVVAVVRDGSSLFSLEERVPAGEVDAWVASVSSRGDVLFAGTAGSRRIHSDPLVPDLWGHARLGFERRPELSSPSGILVAVLDTGVDASHPDLSGRVMRGADMVGSSGRGDRDPNGHGTHVAGIVAAVAGNGLGVAGFAHGVDILPVRVLGSDGFGDDSDLARGIVWAVDNGADIINMSVGGAEDMGLLRAAVDYANERGVLLVASAGNDALWGNAPSYPAAYPGVVAVAATSPGDMRAMFSNTGSYVELAAPGVSILSTWPGGRYIYSSGTSMSAPYVSAAAALVMSTTGARGHALRSSLAASAVDLGRPGRDEEFGFGLVDPFAASGGAPLPASPPPSSLPGLDPSLPELPAFDLPFDLPTFDLPPLPLLSDLLPDLPPVPDLLDFDWGGGGADFPDLPGFAAPELGGLPSVEPVSGRASTSLRASAGSGYVELELEGPVSLVAFRSVTWESYAAGELISGGEVKLDREGRARLRVPSSADRMSFVFSGSLTTLPSSAEVALGRL